MAAPENEQSATASAAVARSRSLRLDPYRLLQLGLLALRAGPALILVILVVSVALTTPVFRTSANAGNVLSQTAVISVLALAQLLVIVTRGIDLSVGSTIALSSVVGAIVFTHVQSGVLVILAMLATGGAVGAFNAGVFVWGRIPHSFMVQLATLRAVRGIGLWGARGRLLISISGSCRYLGGDGFPWLTSSF